MFPSFFDVWKRVYIVTFTRPCVWL